MPNIERDTNGGDNMSPSIFFFLYWKVSKRYGIFEQLKLFVPMCNINKINLFM